MKINNQQLIAGIKPARLKGLLRKERFDTPQAMGWLEQDEPKITRTLKRLERNAWIEFNGTQEGIDHWKVGSRGARLAATKL